MQMYSVYNTTRRTWATRTNFSTVKEAHDLLRCIVAQRPPYHYDVIAVPHRELSSPQRDKFLPRNLASVVPINTVQA